MANNLSEEVKTLLADYFEACAHLYGVIPLKSFLKIYNSQNEPPVTEEELKELTDSINFDERFYDLVAEDEIYETEEPTKYLNKTLTAEYLYCFGDWDDYVEMLDMQQGMNFFIY